MVEEKESPAHVCIEDHKETGSRDSSDDGVLLENDKRASAERRLVKKLDYRLLPTIVVIFIMNFIDVRQPHRVQYSFVCSWILMQRSGVTSARLDGLEQDLHLTGKRQFIHLSVIYMIPFLAEIQYSVVVAILFVAYCPAQIPSNMVITSL
jgi:hypothetical protein